VATLRRQFASFVKHEPGARLGEDEEDVHDMRVATRRMRAALRLFRDYLPKRTTARMMRELRWIALALGEVRDLDVLITQIRAWEGGSSSWIRRRFYPCSISSRSEGRTGAGSSWTSSIPLDTTGMSQRCFGSSARLPRERSGDGSSDPGGDPDPDPRSSP